MEHPLESERAWFMSVYAAIVGGVLAFLADKGFGEESQWAIYFLMWITLIGLFLTRRWCQAFEEHEGKVKAIVAMLGFQDLDMMIPRKGIYRVLYTKRLFYLFYTVIFVGLVVFRILFPPAIS